MKIIVLGAGSFAREVTDLASDLGWTVAAYVVNVLSGKCECWPMYHVVHDAPQHRFTPEPLPMFVPGIVHPDRMNLYDEMLVRGFKPVSLIHPSASVSKSALAGFGCVVSRGVVVASCSVVGVGVIVNRGATIGHDCMLFPFSTIGPGANLAGGVEVGTGATIGMGANVREGVKIGPRAIVGMGAVVLENVPPGETWYGVPAKRIK